jgi:excisionase family DNA binding protein
MTPGEVAALFRVDPKTVTRWAASGRISSIRTPGGHRRFRESEVQALLRGEIDEDLEHLMLQGAAVGGRALR